MGKVLQGANVGLSTWIVVAMTGCLSNTSRVPTGSGEGMAPVDAGPNRTAPETSGVMWVGAHPDDESFIAPQFAAECTEMSGTCTLLVMTRGEGGRCKRPEICSAGLAQVRAGELAKSAALLGADFVHWDFPDFADGTDVGIQKWSAHAGGDEALLRRVREVVTARAPKIIYTFDPRHGSTCHPGHRATAIILFEALKNTPFAQAIRFLESVTDIASPPDAGPMFMGIRAAVPADRAVMTFEASTARRSGSGDYWSYFPDVMALHASQYYASEITTVRSAPIAGRKVFWLGADSAKPDTRYDAICNKDGGT